MQDSFPDNLVSLDTNLPIWSRVFTVAPLVLIGTREPNGDADLAPKHMVTPMGWENYFGFVCTPRHSTYRNVQRSGVFTVSYPSPSQLIFTSLTAAPRCGDDKPNLLALPTFPAKHVDCVLIRDAYLYFECEHFKTIDDFGDNSLITGRIIAAYARQDALRSSDGDDQELIRQAPLLAYLAPGRFAKVEQSYSFPFPAGMQK